MLLGSERVHAAPQIIGLRRDLDRDRLAVETRLGRIGRQVTGLVAGDHRFDLAEALAARRFEPVRLGLWNSHPGQLAYRRMRQLAIFQRFCNQRQLANSARDPKALGCRMRRIAHRALHVLEQRPEPVVAPQLDLLGISQQMCFLGVEHSPPS